MLAWRQYYNRENNKPFESLGFGWLVATLNDIILNFKKLCYIGLGICYH